MGPRSAVPHPRAADEGIQRRGAHLAHLKAKAKAFDLGVPNWAPTQTQADKWESESQATQQARLPFVVWLEQAACFATSLLCGGICDIHVFKAIFC